MKLCRKPFPFREQRLVIVDTLNNKHKNALTKDEGKRFNLAKTAAAICDRVAAAVSDITEVIIFLNIQSRSICICKYRGMHRSGRKHDPVPAR